ncbi:DUF4342 domain-containing protein [Chloroflexus sp.]|uniref:DUF4342 domain-containing protein n=1 Tax=Chloroflexus sp. TaxID=1904827 RepID=UPI00404A35C0
MDIATEVVHGWRLLARVRELLDEPCVQQLIVRNEAGDVVMTIEVSTIRTSSTTRPVLAAVKAIAEDLPRVVLEVGRTPAEGAVGELTRSEELDRALDLVEPVFERY